MTSDGLTERPSDEAAVDHVAVTADVIDVAALIAHVADPVAGAVVTFLGTVRDHSPARGDDPAKTGVTHLEYEAYDGVVVTKIAEIVAEARRRWSLVRVAAVHRIGELGVGEVSVGVAVSSAHRIDAFPAASYVIDELKHRAPIWKKEHWDGGAVWVREDDEHSRQE